MGALSLPKPRNQNQYGRDPESPSERLRNKTNYKQGTGYAPLFAAMFVDLRRLSRGMSCHNLILAVLELQERSGKDGWTPFLSLEEWADLGYCDAKEVQRNRDYLKARKMSEVQTNTKRQIAFRLKPETWEALEDYKTWQAKQLKAEADEEPAADDPAQNDETKAGNWRMSKPVTVERGKRSKPYVPDCGMARFLFDVPKETPAGVDIAFFSAVKAGSLIITPIVTLQNGVQKAKDAGNKQVKKIPEDMDVLGDPRKEGESKKRTPEVNHPRAAELIQLFDPLLGKSGAVLLAMDHVSLLAACKAVQDCDHDYLVKFAVQRGASPIRKPSHVKLICEEALASWKASQKAAAKGSIGKLPTLDEIHAMAEKEREARKVKR